MGSWYEVEVTVTSAKDLKNVNWRHGPLKPYAVVWIDPKAKSSTRVDEEGDTCPFWNETLVIPFNSPIQDSTLYIDIVQANAADDTKPLIGSARLRLIDVVDEAGLGRPVQRKLELKRPSGRPQGNLEVQVNVREPRYRAPDPYYAPPYGVPPPPTSYGYAQPAAGNPYSAAAAAAPPPPYYQPVEEKKKSKFGGMGTGLAVGAVAGAVGGLALAEGIDYVEGETAEDAAEKVEEDFGYDDGGDAGDW
ncbi:hypothetical protein ACH5RR_019701 [Cinchona calisaya]|uniref:C2 domain-containing protein n=1 Tax=Cinchona calisaya TaxID=153742 RepID=A0ABD2ZTQ0_9GENT